MVISPAVRIERAIKSGRFGILTRAKSEPQISSWFKNAGNYSLKKTSAKDFWVFKSGFSLAKIVRVARFLYSRILA